MQYSTSIVFCLVLPTPMLNLPVPSSLNVPGEGLDGQALVRAAEKLGIGD